MPNDGTLGTIETQDGRVVAQAQQMTSDDRNTDHQERRANARLLAAAPEMYEAIGDLILALCAGAGQGMTEVKRSKAIAKGRAAIEKVQPR